VEKTGLAAVFVHPMAKVEGNEKKRRTVRISLGVGKMATINLAALNTIFLDPDLWLNPPSSNEYIRTEWLRHCGNSRGKEVDLAAVVSEDAGRQLESLTQQLAEAHAQIRIKDKQIQELLGRKHRTGPWPTLKKALEDWTVSYTGRDSGHTRNVAWILGAFVEDQGEEKTLDMIEGRESEIEAWLRKKDLTAGVRQQYRRYILRFLKDSGIVVDAEKISNPKRHEIRRDRGSIDWLDDAAAAAVGEALTGYWRDFWTVQLFTGLRPTEQLTLQRSNFRGNMLTLAPLKHLTLKVGPRSIRVEEEAMAIVRRRLEAGGDLVFPEILFGASEADPAAERKPWRTDDLFSKRYRGVLDDVKVAGVGFTPDGRTARRTFASIQIRRGMGVEPLAKYMGTSPDILREHYAAILPQEVALKPKLDLSGQSGKGV